MPVKPLHNGKRRLSHLLSAEERADLVHRLLTRLLVVLQHAPEVDRTLVVSGDESVLMTAVSLGAESLLETAVTGLNPAVTQAVNYARDKGATAVLILPADLPFIQTPDVAIMVEAGLGHSHIVICPDDKNSGTNALLISPPGEFTFHYGENSFQCHIQEAYRRGRTTHIIHASGLQFDLDTEINWRDYQLTINKEQVTRNDEQTLIAHC